MELTFKQKAAYGIGAVGKDMVYALSASYAMYFYQDVLGLSATFVGLILMIAVYSTPQTTRLWVYLLPKPTAAGDASVRGCFQARFSMRLCCTPCLPLLI